MTRRTVSRPRVLPAQRTWGWHVSQEADLAAQLWPKDSEMAFKPQSPWVEPSMRIPGLLAIHNVLSRTDPDSGVIGEWISKQVLRKRGGQDSRGHLTCLSMEPRTCSSDTHGYFLQGHTASWELAFGPATGACGSCSEVSIKRELGGQLELWINSRTLLNKHSPTICSLSDFAVRTEDSAMNFSSKMCIQVVYI